MEAIKRDDVGCAVIALPPDLQLNGTSTPCRVLAHPRCRATAYSTGKHTPIVISPTSHTAEHAHTSLCPRRGCTPCLLSWVLF